MHSRQYTIKDIAKRLKISASTVSRALRDLPDVKADTMAQVKALAKELNYLPNPIAQSLVKNRSYNIGVIIPEFMIHFYSDALSGIYKVANKAGYNVMVCQTNESYRNELKSIKSLVSSRVDGLIVAISKETNDFDHLNSLNIRKTPLVVFNRVSKEITASKVVLDDFKSGYKATRHLIDCGCRHIAHIAGPMNLQLSIDRMEGFKKALEKSGIPYEEELVAPCDFSIEDGKEAMEKILQSGEKIDGVFSVCDAAAYGAMSVLKNAGYKIPEDVSVIGFTNEPFAKLIEPSLSTISQPSFEMGEIAAHLLLKHIENKENFVPEMRILETELIERNSTRRI
ncbi:MAG: LacI family transcriptional regulator [Cyclobacteriaceae bacterium]|nr:LacI family transcriptional regulator [Cyclobacteriaceae bacterium]